jgi:sterol desaturase/sphingolipid hydroxylase (fatty acid hydroxylase superfamily)
MDRVFGFINFDDFLFNEEYNHLKNNQFYWSNSIYCLRIYVGNLMANNYYQRIYSWCKFDLFNQTFHFKSRGINTLLKNNRLLIFFLILYYNFQSYWLISYFYKKKMNEIISYFETIPSLHRALILAGGITFFWLIETIKPLFLLKYSKWKHAGINIFFTVTTIVVNFLMAFILLWTSQWSVQNNIGLLPYLGTINPWIYMIIGLLLLDLIGAYLVHYVEHKVKFLWRFHLIHHSDTWVDTTTANRHHPGESVLRFVFTALAVVIVGAPMWLVFLYQSLSVVLSQFNHANISLPVALDRWMSYIIVSPDMHKVHHHFELPHTDSNYGNIFSIWDRIFGTFSTLKREEIVYGIDTHMEIEKNNSVGNLLKIPFQKRSNFEKP